MNLLYSAFNVSCIIDHFFLFVFPTGTIDLLNIVQLWLIFILPQANKHKFFLILHFTIFFRLPFFNSYFFKFSFFKRKFFKAFSYPLFFVKFSLKRFFNFSFIRLFTAFSFLGSFLEPVFVGSGRHSCVSFLFKIFFRCFKVWSQPQMSEWLWKMQLIHCS